MIRRAMVPWLIVVVIAGLSGRGVWAEPSKPAADRLTDEEDVYELHRLLVDALDQVERNYVRDVSRRELIEAAIRGIVEDLDPYSSYITRDEMKSFRATVESEFGGVGIQISLQDGHLKVLSPLVGTPAYEAGVVAGDRIVEINGKSTAGIKLDEAVRQLKGPKGSEVTLTLIHPGHTNKDTVKIVREVIRVRTVLGDQRKADDSWNYMLDEDQRIGYIRITAFSRNTAAELRGALAELDKENLAGMILDLRFNPGGLLSSAIEVSDLFVSEGRIVSTEGRNSPARTWDAHAKGTYQGFPMVVLVNRYSASASEILAACLQDHDRAIIMGERTWGKGSVQNVIEMENRQSALKLTTASYRRPSGKNIHRFPKATDDDEWGVLPDDGFRLRLTDREVLSLVENRRRRDVLKPRQPEEAEPADGQGTGDKEPATGTEPSDATEMPPEEDVPPEAGPNTPEYAGPNAKPKEPGFTDPHLRMAMDYLTGELARAE